MAHDPLAHISHKAQLGTDVEVGPFCVIESGAVIGDRCQLAARVTVKRGVTLGADNIVEEGAVLGGRPQHLQRLDNTGPVIIGDRNVIRENVTVHRAMTPEGQTVIGNECLLMVASHVAHDCDVGDNVVLTNNVMLAGHVTVGGRAYLGGGVAVHQFCRVGRIAMVGGLARITQDVPPFVMVDGDSSMVVGLNKVGLRRAGFLIEDIKEVKAAYQLFYRSGMSFEERLDAFGVEFTNGPGAEFGQFFHGGSRGFLRQRRTPPGATIRPIQEAAADREESAPVRIKRAS